MRKTNKGQSILSERGVNWHVMLRLLSAGVGGQLCRGSGGGDDNDRWPHDCQTLGPIGVGDDDDDIHRIGETFSWPNRQMVHQVGRPSAV